MQPIPTDGPIKVLLDPYGYFDGLLSEPVLYVMQVWAGRLAPEMTPTDFMVSYYNVLRDIREGAIRSPLTYAAPAVHNLLFVMYPHLLRLVIPDRADELKELWRRTFAEVGVGGPHA